MGSTEHIAEFIKALNGKRGDLDAWLECNNEAECRAAILGAIENEREACAKEAEAAAELKSGNDMRRKVSNQIAGIIRGRSNEPAKGPGFQPGPVQAEGRNELERLVWRNHRR